MFISDIWRINIQEGPGSIVRHLEWNQSTTCFKLEQKQWSRECSLLRLSDTFMREPGLFCRVGSPQTPASLWHFNIAQWVTDRPCTFKPEGWTVPQSELNVLRLSLGQLSGLKAWSSELSAVMRLLLNFYNEAGLLSQATRSKIKPFLTFHHGRWTYSLWFLPFIWTSAYGMIYDIIDVKVFRNKINVWVHLHYHFRDSGSPHEIFVFKS